MQGSSMQAVGIFKGGGVGWNDQTDLEDLSSFGPYVVNSELFLF